LWSSLVARHGSHPSRGASPFVLFALNSFLFFSGYNPSSFGLFRVCAWVDMGGEGNSGPFFRVVGLPLLFGGGWGWGLFCGGFFLRSFFTFRYVLYRPLTDQDHVPGATVPPPPRVRRGFFLGCGPTCLSFFVYRCGCPHWWFWGGFFGPNKQHWFGGGVGVGGGGVFVAGWGEDTPPPWAGGEVGVAGGVVGGLVFLVGGVGVGFWCWVLPRFLLSVRLTFGGCMGGAWFPYGRQVTPPDCYCLPTTKGQPLQPPQSPPHSPPGLLSKAPSGKTP